MKYFITFLLLLAVGFCQAQSDSTEVKERYTYKEGSKFVKNEANETEIIDIKDAFVQFKMIDDVMFLTVFYNPSSIFRKKAVVEYRVDSEFYKDDINNVYQARGSHANGDGNLRDSYLFTFDPGNSQLTITNLSTDMVEFIFTGQNVPDMPEFQRRQEETTKTQLKQLEE